MALPTKTLCILCEKIKVTFRCRGCSNDFCLHHLTQHHINIQKQFDHLQNDHDQLRQQTNDYKMDPTKHPVIKQIDQWEEDAINKIKQHAQLCKTKWIDHSNAFLQQIEDKLSHLADEFKDIREDNAFNEIDLNDLKQRLERVEKELNYPTNNSTEQGSTSFINEISLLIPFAKGKNQSKFFLRNKIFCVTENS